ncbi:saccharopine dehydrogenase NADP-binding domain-containing protein [Clostridium senegalense]|uniref:saccharopine dehydrogenase NADP-binding domain-containing protein n=1 Tax=Clostridium senegalense TaxID=1465809 RepID=UPI001C10A244|nr:saccharopine dehydrogenase NADP-binding domain-containing protein [Clostridium senegalense]MBU5228212.1 saccharopine dehydrogenase NADP-binding domain-containing protein [Clostridium senegalense]
MDKKIIGILGATGVVGIGAVKTILKLNKYDVLLGYRNLEKIKSLYKDMISEDQYMKVEINNEDLVDNFCDRCDLVVNCAGPSNLISIKVAKSCIKKNVNYLDVSGNKALYDYIKEKQSEIIKKKLLFIISAGIYPGLSEIYPAYISESIFDKVDKLEIYFNHKGEMSFNAAYDFVCGIEENSGQGMMYCRDGISVKLENRRNQNYKDYGLEKSFDVYPVLNTEFIGMVRQQKIKNAYFYNVYEDKSILNDYVIIKALKQYETEKQKKESARLLMKHNLKSIKKDEFVSMDIQANGYKDNCYIEVISKLLCKYDGNKLSGVVAANVVDNIISNKSNIVGTYYPSQIINLKNFINRLIDQSIIIKTEILNIEEGMI